MTATLPHRRFAAWPFAPWIISAFFHLLFLLAGGSFFYSPPQFGVDTAVGGVEVNLVAAPLPSSELKSEVEAPVKTEQVVQNLSPDAFTLPKTIKEKKIEKETSAEKPQDRPALPSSAVGDGSSAIPGTDKTTLQSTSAALKNEQPTYLNNPTPPYPELAKAQGQEGVVHLKVEVSDAGVVIDLNIKKSSGFLLLDEAALNTVRKWKFKPGKIGGLATSMSVAVPVRFKIEENEE